MKQAEVDKALKKQRELGEASDIVKYSSFTRRFFP